MEGYKSDYSKEYTSRESSGLIAGAILTQPIAGGKVEKGIAMLADQILRNGQ